MEPSCPLCSEPLNGVDYVAHLGDVHGLVDDPGTSSVPPADEPAVQAFSPLEPPASPAPEVADAADGVEAGTARAPALPRGVTLAPGEVLVAFFEGEGPPPPQIGGRKKSMIVGGVIGGAVGAAVGAAVAGGAEKYRGSIESRTLVLTNQRMLFLMFHIPESAVPVEAVKGAFVKYLGPLRRAVVVKFHNARSVRVEGAPGEAESFAASVNAYIAYADRVRHGWQA